METVEEDLSISTETLNGLNLIFMEYKVIVCNNVRIVKTVIKS